MRNDVYEYEMEEEEGEGEEGEEGVEREVKGEEDRIGDEL